MGTSKSFGGQGNKTPLLPTWADSPEAPPPSDNPESDTAPDRPSIPKPPTDNRFQIPRSNFTRYVSSGGNDKGALGRAVSGYVRGTAGGARKAAIRMGAERGTASRLTGLLQDIQRSGVTTTLKRLNFEHLVGKEPQEILAALVDTVCVEGGSIDEGIARDAYIDAILEIESINLDKLSTENITEIITCFISNSISKRLQNDIGTNLVNNTLTEGQAIMLEKQINDFVSGAIKDKLYDSLVAKGEIDKASLDKTILDVYEVAYSLIDEEANRL